MFQVPPNSEYFLEVSTVSLVIQQLIHLPDTVTLTWAMTYNPPPTWITPVVYPTVMSWQYHIEIWKIVFFYYLIYSDKVFTVSIYFSHILWK